MLLQIPNVLSPQQVEACRALIDAATWVDGGVTAGFQSGQVKHNEQLPAEDANAGQASDLIRAALAGNLLFASAALPARVLPPMFNRYREGHDFGVHVDNAIRQIPGTDERLRTDLAATLFLSDAESYDGGELVVEDTYGTRAIKLPAGHLVLYPATSLHRVQPVTRGARVASFFWIQSLVREDAQRTLLFDLDMAIVRLRQRLGDEENIVALTGVYHNLLRRWASP